MEPCTHYGVTSPCTDLIKKKKIKNVFFSSSDVDKRTSNKAISRLKGIQVRKLEVKKFNNFYESYEINKEKLMPFINAKIALSKDLYSISKKKKWITNSASRSRVHLIRSEYDTIISTSKSINKDNSLLNCRLNGFDNTKPSLIIVDLNLKIKKNLKLFKLTKKRKITIISSVAKGEKISFLKKIGVRFITISSLKTKDDFSNLFKLLKKRGHNRILIETGLTFLFSMLKFNLINYFYIFVSKVKLGKQGRNNIRVNMLKSLKLHKEMKVNLYGDKLYKINIKNV